jgi:two-component system invasion response regulator UvrY
VRDASGPKRAGFRGSDDQPEMHGLNIPVLIVDDHDLMRDTLRSFLERLPGFEVVGEAENGRVAVQLAREKKPAVVVMDVIMPEMDGIEATRLITTEMPGVKVIVLSLHCDEGCRETLIQAGASDFVSKESAFEELVNVLGAGIANGSQTPFP